MCWPHAKHQQEVLLEEKIMKIGIMSKDDYRKRTIAIARGEYKPRKDEPKVWFESMESLDQVLSAQNQQLLRLIRDRHPASLVEFSG